MKVYLVGGAVRDELLGLPVKERDWVVVGATKEDLLKQNFNQVGRDFPVFLHPKTQEEYALARTERKSAPGYYGFECDFSPEVTLEEDLARRDLTINAMARDENGHLIDPFKGRADLNDKLLRHVSDAFVEDPVRVLRVARFAAKFHYLGFKLANETRQLMYEMVKKGELSHLVPERVWQEWVKSLSEKNPEQFILSLRSCDALRVILPEIEALFGVPNTYHYHREIDSGVHTMLVLQACVVRSASPMTRFSALVHDLGKAKTPMQKWPKHHGHEMAGVPIIKALCQRLKIPNDYSRLAMMVSQYHLTIHRLMELRPPTIVDLLEKTDAFRRPSFFNQMLIACEADAHGCGREINYEVGALWKDLLALCMQVQPTPFIAQGYEGKALGEAIRQERINLVKQKLTLWKSNEKK